MRSITTKGESTIATDVLSKAYADAPNISWMFKQSPKNNTLFFSLLVDEAMGKKGAYLTPNNRGVLLLYSLETKYFSLKTICRKAYLVFFVIGLRKSLQIQSLEKTKRKYRPKTGLYGASLAINKDEYKRETMYELKKWKSLLSTLPKQTIYAETTNRRIALLYERMGFSSYNEIKHPYADLPIYFMKMENK